MLRRGERRGREQLGTAGQKGGWSKTQFTGSAQNLKQPGACGLLTRDHQKGLHGHLSVHVQKEFSPFHTRNLEVVATKGMDSLPYVESHAAKA